MQQNSLFQGCSYSNFDTTNARNGWSLCPEQDIGTVLTNRYGVNVNADDTFSLLYCDLYLRQQLKHTMLVQESVFESQIHELHRLYRRQKELMMEMEVNRHHEALYLNSSFPSYRTHWMNSSASTFQSRNFPYEENICKQIEVVDTVEKSEKKVLDLGLPVFEYNGREEERSSMNGEVHEDPNFLKEQSLRRMSPESGNQSNKLQLDLNEPAKVEEHSDYVFNQFLSPVTSNEFGEDSDTKNEGEDSAKGSNGMNEAQGSVKCREENGIDLNMAPLPSEEEVTMVTKSETKKPQESLSVSLHGKHGSKQSRVIIQALPCSTSILLLGKQYKPLMRGSRPKKKVKRGPSNKTFIGSDLDPHSSAQASSESQSNEASMEKGSSSSLSKETSAGNETSQGKKRRYKPEMKSSKSHKVVAKKSGKIKRKKSRRISLVTEENYQEISAAEAMVYMSRKSGRETAECITSLSKNLLWFAEISSSVAEDYEIDFVEAMTLQLTEKKLEEHGTDLQLNSSDNKTAVSSIVHGKQRRRSRPRQGKRKCKDDQHDDNLSSGTSSECEDLQVLGKLIEASKLKWNCGFPKNKRKRSAPKVKYAFTSLVKEKMGVDWGAINKRRRGSRIPAVDFKHMIINQVV